MEKSKLLKSKKLLLEVKSKVLNSKIMSNTSDLEVAQEDRADETDLANSVIEQQVTFNLRNKELAKLRAVEFALMRIEDGSYGHCEECEEEIGAKRLQTQPWADLCIVHAEERERENKKRAF